MDLQTWQFTKEILHDIYLDDIEIEKHKHDSNYVAPEYWHYTSLGGVLGIFKDYIDNQDSKEYIDSCSLFASNIRFMNDKKEYVDGKTIFDDRVAKLSQKAQGIISHARGLDNEKDSIYSISFCNSGDLLSQWKWYGKRSGVSFSLKILDESFCLHTYAEKDANGNIVAEPPDLYTRPIRIRYTDKDKVEFFNSLLHKRFTDVVNKQLLEDKIGAFEKVFVPFCKHRGFIEEKESRMVFFVTPDLPRGSGNKVLFNYTYNTAEKGRVKPTIIVKMDYLKEVSPLEANPKVIDNNFNIIDKMVVGPGENQELVFNALIHIFDRDNYSYHEPDDLGEEIDSNKVTRKVYQCKNGLKIYLSSIPFRG